MNVPNDADPWTDDEQDRYDAEWAATEDFQRVAYEADQFEESNDDHPVH